MYYGHVIFSAVNYILYRRVFDDKIKVDKYILVPFLELVIHFNIWQTEWNDSGRVKSFGNTLRQYVNIGIWNKKNVLSIDSNLPFLKENSWVNREIFFSIERKSTDPITVEPIGVINRVQWKNLYTQGRWDILIALFFFEAHITIPNVS